MAFILSAHFGPYLYDSVPARAVSEANICSAT